ncbi:low molecular weight phosphatase family protein [Roseospirillum parvum]|uniref:Protein-tyrosine-phosphatase n=1 Tax=Roseospirillum parvum TaxID=83401 RepID=A0A1G8BW68_9PROT|nr:arsenate reductase ArsC [Roseospirillum parvum]SDH37477.1 Protein-tyrosine-phosphatase [Roseospirillum parvum]
MSGLPSAILFACTMNAVRSPMAEGLMKRFHGKRVFVDSVGVKAQPVDGFAIAALDEVGIDISHHRPKTFEELEDGSFDVIVSLSPEAQHKAVDLTRHMACEVLFWHTFDPSIVEGCRETRLDAYRAVRDELEQRILTTFPPPTMASVG